MDNSSSTTDHGTRSSGTRPNETTRSADRWRHSTPPAHATDNELATASLVLGIVGLALFWLTAIGAVLGLIATIFGIIGISAARRSAIRPRERQAWAGVITGVVAISLAFGSIVVIEALGNSAEDRFIDVSDELDDGIDPALCSPDRVYQHPDC